MSIHDEDLQISEGELTVLTSDLDEAHHATLPAMHEAVAEFSEQLRDATTAKPFNRRRFLLAGTAVGGSIALAACGSSSSGSAGKSTTAGEHYHQVQPVEMQHAAITTQHNGPQEQPRQSRIWGPQHSLERMERR